MYTNTYFEREYRKVKSVYDSCTKSHGKTIFEYIIEKRDVVHNLLVLLMLLFVRFWSINPLPFCGSGF